MTGSGTLADPYVIWDVDDLQDMSLDLTAYYELGQDIDASATVGWNAGEGFDPIGDATVKFTGHFDGKGYKVTDLTINRPAESYIGLFGYTESPATIQNLGLESVSIIGNAWVGALCGYLMDSAIEACYSTGTVFGNLFNVGGLIGRTNRSTGMVTIDKCYSECSVNSDPGSENIGGLVGLNGTTAGVALLRISNCYARGSVSGDDNVGGLVGSNSVAGSIDKCYSTGAVTGTTDVGGLVGRLLGSATTTNSFWDTDTSGLLVSAGGTGKTTAEMKTGSTFTDAGWSFGTIWGMTGACNNGYPCLLDVTPSCAWAPVAARKGNIVIDQLIYQHAERMR